MAKFKVIVRNVHVYSNLEVRLKSRTTKEEANKEVERMVEKKDLFKEYEWKIEGCEDGGINNFDNNLTEKIVERIDQEETDENIFWDGFTAHYDLNVSHILVNTNLETPLKSTQYYDVLIKIFGVKNIKKFYKKIFNPKIKKYFFTDYVYFWYKTLLLGAIKETQSKTYNCTNGGILYEKPVIVIKLEKFAKMYLK